MKSISLAGSVAISLTEYNYNWKFDCKTYYYNKNVIHIDIEKNDWTLIQKLKML